MICTTRIIISGYQIKNEMGAANGTHGGKRKIHTAFWLENPKERDRVEDLRTDGMKIMKWILKKKNWTLTAQIHLMQDGDMWGSPCKHGMKLYQTNADECTHIYY